MPLTLKLLAIAALISPTLGANFKQCRRDIEEIIALNGTLGPSNSTAILMEHYGFDPIYHGSLFGFKGDTSQRPLTLTLQGCSTICGADADLLSVMDAFQILTTWVLPAVALLSQLPYKSLGNRKRRNLEAFLNWFGGPAATLSTTLHNIFLIQRCSSLSHSSIWPDLHIHATDAYYVLSCINQYEFPTYGRNWDARNLAVLQGTLWPLLQQDPLLADKREQLRKMTSNLAFQLRMQRRKAVWPLAVSIIWFLIAFVISIVTAFAELGDNTKAHSLALGLLLSWLPVVVVTSIVDRNPVSAARCANLIQRWLYNVRAVV